MALNISDAQAAVSTQIERDLRTGLSEGISGGYSYPSSLTAEQYDAQDEAAKDGGRKFNAALVHGFGSLPFKLVEYSTFNLPDAGTWVGSIIYCSNGANGGGIVAFSDGSNWLRIDTRTAVSSI